MGITQQLALGTLAHAGTHLFPRLQQAEPKKKKTKNLLLPLRPLRVYCMVPGLTAFPPPRFIKPSKKEANASLSGGGGGGGCGMPVDSWSGA